MNKLIFNLKMQKLSLVLNRFWFNFAKRMSCLRNEMYKATKLVILSFKFLLEALTFTAFLEENLHLL